MNKIKASFELQSHAYREELKRIFESKNRKEIEHTIVQQVKCLLELYKQKTISVEKLFHYFEYVYGEKVLIEEYEFSTDLEDLLYQGWLLHDYPKKLQEYNVKVEDIIEEIETMLKKIAA